MDADERNGDNVILKRQRTPFSDSEDNVLSPGNDGQKRQRLESAGRENHSPKPSFSGRMIELQTKPDTPVVPSVRSRVQLLSQKRDGGAPLAQRCLSDPGANRLTGFNEKAFREQCLGVGEFHQRMEQYQVPIFQASPVPAKSPVNLSRRACSLVSGIQQKLQCCLTSSYEQASRIREERRLELSKLQPISENAWLKRSNLDSSLTQAENDVEIRDGSFQKIFLSSAEKKATYETEINFNGEANTAEIIDQMFEKVLDNAVRLEKENKDYTKDHGGTGACSVDRDKTDRKSEKRRNEQEHEKTKKLEDVEDELLTFPPSGILSPLSKSVEAVVTPLQLTVSQESNLPSLLLTTHPAEADPLYSVDAYRTQRQTKNLTTQCVTPDVQRKVLQKSHPQPSVNSKERIIALHEEAVKLQTVVSQTLQALSCCTDEDHGRGSLEEAEAEKLLLVSCEKRAALLAEITRLREEKNSESEEASGEELDCVFQQPCRGTVVITNIRLPLKLEFVCSSHNRPGRPSHYFFILIRYGPCNIVATPLATAADAQNGDTISFPTSVTLKDIRSSFEIDVEVYSLSPTLASCTMDRTKSRITPRKLLNTITRSKNDMSTNFPSTAAASSSLNTRRSSNFSLVGSHKITLASLGLSKFPLDKMKLEGKVRRLLGDEFQEKVPFLSPLEGHIYLHLDSKSHSTVHHQGFLTMFEFISGYGVWNRRYFALKGCAMYYWNHPNDKETKEAEGSISLSISYQSIRPVQRNLCARPFTFELVRTLPQEQEDNGDNALAKCWFSADTKQERLDWMERLSQVLLDFHTWNRTLAAEAEGGQSNTLRSGSLRESIL